ncbi:hypothetical protein [Chitinophaga nivalis]|uniref:Pentapeptide repeat-containing protein n=1 Tax=Chitinophaga nivalis TaxID=2991709 RepID=A0ABT3INU4_9BACT|nr:hypothetical protein [Chitinophaga nivalis]MCW3464854.1 hypothetical protein [Chitinophaga nivalis]MCW3485455.1 hypothetical protein [Chitinophaga nivalis]
MKKKTHQKLKLAKISISHLNTATLDISGNRTLATNFRTCYETWRIC